VEKMTNEEGRTVEDWSELKRATDKASKEYQERTSENWSHDLLYMKTKERSWK
jgi:cyclopropane fatty-acyl-phospholipid synthase-like methyltransferase